MLKTHPSSQWCRMLPKFTFFSVTKTLRQYQWSSLAKVVVYERFVTPIKSMSTHKDLGPDGMTAAFYQIVPEAFTKILLIVFKYQLERGVLLPEQHKSCVVLLHKKGPRALPGNYRPTALIHVDVEVLSRVMTSRLRGLIPALIDQDQKGFVRAWSIHHHITALRDLQHLCTEEDIEDYGTFLDFEEAYGRDCWDYLIAVMRRMNIGDEFVSWAQVLLTASRVSLILKGWIQDPSEPTRGVKQGDPLSPLLFLSSLDPMCNLLRQHPSSALRSSHVQVSLRLVQTPQTTRCCCPGVSLVSKHSSIWSKSIVLPPVPS